MSNYELDTRKFLSDSKFYEGYSRFIEDKNRYETWDEAVDRVMDMHRTYYADKITPELEEYINFAEIAYKEKFFLGAQRALQFGGDQLLKNPSRLFNCTASYVDRPAFFGEAFHWLLSGAGVGFSVQKHHVARLPKIMPRLKQSKVFTPDDSIEGWSDTLDVLLSSFFEDGGKYPEYASRKVYFDLSKIRPKGSKISGGFKAPGPEPLRNALNKIENILTMVAFEKRNLKPIEAYDIIMHAADAVISGGVRRSATIALFSVDDDEMMNAKTGNWFVENPQRGRSNNSAVLLRGSVTKEEFDNLFNSVREFGEPGFLFVDDLEHLTNPCVEIGLFAKIKKDGVWKSGWQACNLTEINGALCDTVDTFYNACKAASIIGTLQAGYTKFNFISPESREIIEREALLGVSVTGWMNNPHVLLDEKVLRKGAQIVKDINAKIAKMIGIKPAARTTCVKPAGNASVLLMTASGIHGEHSKRYFRHAQMNRDSEVVKVLLDSNPAMIEDSVWSANGSDVVVAFPFISKDGSKYKKDLLGVKQLEVVKLVQQAWVHSGARPEVAVDKTVSHNVSNTISVDNWEEVREYIWNNRNIFSGISLLSATGDKDYAQAPNTEVLTSQEIVDLYGSASLFASGLITSGLDAFAGNLWMACATAIGNGLDISQETHETMLKRDWVRRFKKFSDSYFDGNLKQTEYCLKDVYNNHKWHTIQRSITPLDFTKTLTAKKYTDIDTMAAAACSSPAGCEI